MTAWARAQELEAYGLCGLTPDTFGALTIPQFYSMLEAAYWREARQRRMIARAVACLVTPKPGFTTSDVEASILGGEPEDDICEARAARLREAGADQTWP